MVTTGYGGETNLERAELADLEAAAAALEAEAEAPESALEPDASAEETYEEMSAMILKTKWARLYIPNCWHLLQQCR